MGPITLFDKSFLQSLSIDEAVLFDHFFYTNIAPIFFIETLADLQKAIKSGRTPEQEVGIIAAKTPQVHSAPGMFHIPLCITNFMGEDVVMDGRIILAGGRPVRSKNKSGVVFKRSPEAEAYSRWQDGKFLELERDIAKAWRGMLANLKFDKAIKKLNELGINPKTCRTLEQAKAHVNTVVSQRGNRRFIQLAMRLAGVPMELWDTILRRWKEIGELSVIEFAPYAGYVVSVDLFFYVAAAAGLFSVTQKKVTNRIDLAYLYYLPFCMVFVSSDRIHQRCAPLFVRPDQQFVWGPELKDALRGLDDYYGALPGKQLERGLYDIAGRPPLTKNSLVTEIWDRFGPGWRKADALDAKLDPGAEKRLVQQINELVDAPTISSDALDFDVKDPESIAVERHVQVMRGKYWQIPKDVADKSP